MLYSYVVAPFGRLCCTDIGSEEDYIVIISIDSHQSFIVVIFVLSNMLNKFCCNHMALMREIYGNHNYWLALGYILFYS